MKNDKQNIIIYNTADGKANVALFAKDGMIWMTQKQLSQLFDTSVPNISMHISNILKDQELKENSVIKDYLTTAADGKQDILIAKNYLSKDEIDTLNRLVIIFLETGELRVKNRIDINMKFWRENVDRILEFNEKPLLTGKGKISNAAMKEKIKQIYLLFDKNRKAYEAQEADKEDFEELKRLEDKINQVDG